ncbi:MAG: methyltransferase domain-containing protein, partial [Deltaproteobacteria bacterium]|nr:methyltransferase domain-containing protein [Deltaproteobacteria bacterium]
MIAFVLLTLGIRTVATTRPPNEPEDAKRFTLEWDRAYTAFAQPYDFAVRLLPVWKTWLRRALPHIQGPRVLEVSFGTGYLISQYAGRFQTHGIDYNRKMATIARNNLSRVRKKADLVRGNVEALPYADSSFNSLVNTMAFSGYPNGAQALLEMKLVLRRDGRLILIDFAFPPDQNWKGSKFASLWERSGDILRDMPTLFRDCDFDYTDESIGAWGSVR